MPLDINNTNVKRYSQSFEDYTLDAVQQFLATFGCCPELRMAVEDVIKENQEAVHQAKVAQRQKARELKQKIDEAFLKREMMTDEDEVFPGEPEPLPIIGICPRCSQPLAGGFLQGCETRRSGRSMIKECTICSYYSELFKRPNNVYEEIEGG